MRFKVAKTPMLAYISVPTPFDYGRTRLISQQTKAIYNVDEQP